MSYPRGLLARIATIERAIAANSEEAYRLEAQIRALQRSVQECVKRGGLKNLEQRLERLERRLSVGGSSKNGR